VPFRVGEWLVEPDLDRLSRGDTHRTLRPRVTELLVCLARRAGELVSKQALIDGVWRTEFVTDNALTHLVAELRVALGDDARNPRYVETIPRRGYRLIAATTRVGGDVLPGADEGFRFVLIDEEGHEIGLQEGENLIGRSPRARVRIDSWEVSRRHARILVEDTAATLEDLGSKNGTWVRGRRVEHAARLQDADEIQIGVNLARFRFRAYDDQTRTEQPG
jgi:DNA-binding winged helix-turn-helix (wHTH) protein